jgi:hypothetical protein
MGGQPQNPGAVSGFPLVPVPDVGSASRTRHVPSAVGLGGPRWASVGLVARLPPTARPPRPRVRRVAGAISLGGHSFSMSVTGLLVLLLLLLLLLAWHGPSPLPSVISHSDSPQSICAFRDLTTLHAIGCCLLCFALLVHTAVLRPSLGGWL